MCQYLPRHCSFVICDCIVRGCKKNLCWMGLALPRCSVETVSCQGPSFSPSRGWKFHCEWGMRSRSWPTAVGILHTTLSRLFQWLAVQECSGQLWDNGGEFSERQAHQQPNSYLGREAPRIMRIGGWHGDRGSPDARDAQMHAPSRAAGGILIEGENANVDLAWGTEAQP